MVQSRRGVHRAWNNNNNKNQNGEDDETRLSRCSAIKRDLFRHRYDSPPRGPVFFLFGCIPLIFLTCSRRVLPHTASLSSGPTQRSLCHAGTRAPHRHAFVSLSWLQHSAWLFSYQGERKRLRTVKADGQDNNNAIYHPSAKVNAQFISPTELRYHCMLGRFRWAWVL